MLVAANSLRIDYVAFKAKFMLMKMCRRVGTVTIVEGEKQSLKFDINDAGIDSDGR